MNNKTKGFILVVAAIVLLLTLTSNTYVALNNNFVINGTHCEEDYECFGYTMDCISHFAPKYSWKGDIQCINNICECLSN